jgi:hypothetical protein
MVNDAKRVDGGKKIRFMKFLSNDGDDDNSDSSDYDNDDCGLSQEYHRRSS